MGGELSRLRLGEGERQGGLTADLGEKAVALGERGCWRREQDLDLRRGCSAKRSCDHGELSGGVAVEEDVSPWGSGGC